MTRTLMNGTITMVTDEEVMAILASAEPGVASVMESYERFESTYVASASALAPAMVTTTGTGTPRNA